MIVQKKEMHTEILQLTMEIVRLFVKDRNASIECTHRSTTFTD